MRGERTIVRLKGDHGYEADESTLLDSGDSFRDQLCVLFLIKHVADIYDSMARRDPAHK